MLILGEDLANAFSKRFLLFCADLYFRPSSTLRDLFVHQKLFPKSFYASSVATYYSGSKSGCICWMPKVPSSDTGDVLRNSPP